MKALVFQAAKEVITTSEVEKPVPKEGEVLVHLKASAMNHRDVWMTKGMYPNLEAGVTIGSCGAGLVGDREVIINPNVNWGKDPNYPNHFGYSILGMPVNGTFAEYVAVTEDRLADKPAHLTWEEAAALPLGGLTAYRALFGRARATAKDKVLINGVGGGVALFACQFAIAIGAEVYVTSSSDEKIQKAIDMGAKGGANYKDEKWHKEFGKEHGWVDVVIDSAGGAGFETLLKVCNPRARIAIYGGTRGKSTINPQIFFWKELELYGSTMGNDQEFMDMIALVNEHKIKPVVDSIYDFSNAAEAFERMDQGKQFGKIVFRNQ